MSTATERRLWQLLQLWLQSLQITPMTVKAEAFVFLSWDALHFAGSASQKQQEISYKPFTLIASEHWPRDSVFLLLLRES